MLPLDLSRDAPGAYVLYRQLLLWDGVTWGLGKK